MEVSMLIKAFLVGGGICAIGQLLIDYTKLTPARILVSFVVLGVILGGLGLYQPLIEFAGAGATVPLTGFGATLAKGVREAVAQKGWFGALTGGLSASAGRNHSRNRSRPDSRSAVSFRRKVRRAWKIKKLCTGCYRPVWSFLRLSVYYLPSAWRSRWSLRMPICVLASEISPSITICTACAKGMRSTSRNSPSSSFCTLSCRPLAR